VLREMSHIRGNGAPHQPQKFKAGGPPRGGFGEWAGSGPIDSRGSSPSDLCWMGARWRDLEGSRMVGGSLRWQIPTLTLVWMRAHRLSVFLVSYGRSQFATRVGRRSNQILVRSRFTKICGTLGRLGFLIFIRFM
jgi:hypothetical protein